MITVATAAQYLRGPLTRPRRRVSSHRCRAVVFRVTDGQRHSCRSADGNHYRARLPFGAAAFGRFAMLQRRAYSLLLLLLLWLSKCVSLTTKQTKKSQTIYDVARGGECAGHRRLWKCVLKSLPPPPPRRYPTG